MRPQNPMSRLDPGQRGELVRGQTSCKGEIGPTVSLLAGMIPSVLVVREARGENKRSTRWFPLYQGSMLPAALTLAEETLLVKTKDMDGAPLAKMSSHAFQLCITSAIVSI